MHQPRLSQWYHFQPILNWVSLIARTDVYLYPYFDICGKKLFNYLVRIRSRIPTVPRKRKYVHIVTQTPDLLFSSLSQYHCFISATCVFKKTVSRDLGIFLTVIHRKSLESRPTSDILKFLCCVVIELFSLKDPIRFMQKTYLFPVHIGMPLANASKICRIYGYSTLPD